MKETSKIYFADFSLLLVAIAWGSTFFLAKDLQRTWNAVYLIALQFTLAAAVLGGYLIFRRKNLIENFGSGLLLGLVLWGGYATQHLGLNYTTASNAGFFTGLSVVFVPLAGWLLFRLEVSLKNLIALVVAIVGIWLLSGGITHINPGDLLNLGTALLTTFHILLTNKFVRAKVDPIILTFQQLFIIALVSWIVVGVFHLPVSKLTIPAVGALVYFAIVCNLLAYGAQSVAQKYTTPIKVSLILSMEAVFAAVFAWTVGKEILIFSKALGGILILFAIILTEIPTEKFGFKNSP